MEFIEVFRIIALVIFSLFLIFSLDDLMLDVYYYLKVRKKISGRLKISDFDDVPSKLTAIFIPAWDEQAVIAQMLTNTFASINYPLSSYHVFVGTYPNDEPTQEAVSRLTLEHENLHLVINDKDGPTNKADNLNNMYKTLAKFEEDKGLSFSTVIIHDSEDIIHPTSLKLFNYLIPKYDAVQIPVFPLQALPRITNIFKYFTTGSYADEFAENHLRGLTSREVANAFVPSAGTGFAFSRQTLNKLAAENEGLIFNEESLTEDYEVSLQMLRMGLSVKFFIESVKRVLNNGKIINEFIATREFFPNTFREAVRQKSRWIYGIAFQGPGLFNSRRMNAIQRYSLFKDWKAKYANLLLFPGYLILIYIVATYFLDLEVLVQYKTLLWYLTIIVTIFAIERQILRAIAINKIYGIRSAFLSAFFPPLIPIRYVWGNLINFAATLRAWRIKLFGSREQRRKWEKTPHAYLAVDELTRYRRKLGDLLLEKDELSVNQLKDTLGNKDSGVQLGEQLLMDEAIDEKKLSETLAELLKIPHVDINEKHIDPNLAKHFPKRLAIKYNVLPLIAWKNGIVLVGDNPLSEKEVEEITSITNLMPTMTFSQSIDIKLAIKKLYEDNEGPPRIGELLIQKKNIDESHFIDAINIQSKTGKKLGQIFMEMELITENTLANLATETGV